MNHPSEDALLLFAYGDPGAEDLTAHLGTCADCRARLHAIERARVAVDWTRERRLVPQRRLRWTALVGLAAAAVVAIVVLRPRPDTPPLALSIPRYAVPELTPIDSLLTQLEQERFHAIP